MYGVHIKRIEWHFFLRLLQLEIKDLHVTLERFHFHKIHQNKIIQKER